MRASINVSYQGLGEQAQRLLLLLGTLGATSFADWVAAPLLAAADADDAVDAMNELADASLVTVDTAGTGPARFRLHELVRIFAQETLAKNVPGEEVEAARARYLRCLLYVARLAHNRAHGGEFEVIHPDAELWPLPDLVLADHVADPIEWFVLEQPNLEAGVELAAQIGLADICWDLASTSVTLFEVRAYTKPWRRTAAVALEACRAAGDARGEAAMRYLQGGLALFEDRMTDAREEDTAALAYFKRADDAHARGLVLGDLALIDRLQDRPAQSLVHAEAALEDLRAVGDKFSQARVLGGMAQVYVDQGRYADAERLSQQSLELSREIGAGSFAFMATRSEAQALHRLGHLYMAQHRFDEAHAAYSDVLDLVIKLGDPVGTTYAHLGLALVMLARGDWSTASRSLHAARAAARDTGDRLSLGRVLHAQAQAAWQAGDYDAMKTALIEAREVFAAAESAHWLRQTEELEARLHAVQQRR